VWEDGGGDPASYPLPSHYCFGGHSGEGSVAASGFFPQEVARRAVRAALMQRKIWEIKFLLVSIGSPFNKLGRHVLLDP
jgi:hypothetical protein